MAWQLWIVAADLVLMALVMVSHVGKPRKPITPGDAVAGLIEIGVLLALLATV